MTLQVTRPTDVRKRGTFVFAFLPATDHGNTAMAIGLLGRKVGMTQIFDEAGKAMPVTVIQAGPCHVLQVRTAERDGYEARAARLSRQAPPSGQPQ